MKPDHCCSTNLNSNTHFEDFSRSQCCQRLFNSGQQRAEIVDVVTRSHHDNDADTEA